MTEDLGPMFSREELIQHAHLAMDAEASPLLEVAEFPRHHFRVPVHGERVAHRGGKDVFPSALFFWLCSLRLIDNPRTSRYCRLLAEESLCEPLAEDAYYELMDFNTAMLKRPAPAFLGRRGGFVAALKVYGGVVADQLRTSTLAEFDDGFVAWHCRIREL